MRFALNIFMALMMMGTIIAQAPDAFADEPIRVEVRAISASKAGKGFDSSLSDLKGKLKKGFSGYTKFQQLSSKTVSLRPKTKRSIALPNNSKMTIAFHGTAGKFIKLGLGVAKKMKTMVRATRGSTHFQAGLKHKDGILILAITVK